jgi:hypothetical protein
MVFLLICNMANFSFNINNLWILQSLRSLRMTPKSHSDPEQSEGEESIVTICFYLLVHFVVFKYFLPCKAFIKFII